MSRGGSVCTEIAGKTAGGNTNTGNTSCTITGLMTEMFAVVLGMSVVAAGVNVGAPDISNAPAIIGGASSKMTPSTGWGSC